MSANVYRPNATLPAPFCRSGRKRIEIQLFPARKKVNKLQHSMTKKYKINASASSIEPKRMLGKKRTAATNVNLGKR